MFLHNKNNNILISGALFLDGHQYEYEDWEINIVGLEPKPQNLAKHAVHITHTIINILKLT